MKKARLRDRMEKHFTDVRIKAESNVRAPLVTAMIRRAKGTQLTTLASSISYYLLLAIFPFTLIFSGIITVSGLLDRIDKGFIHYLEEIFPLPVVEFITNFVKENENIGGIPLLSAGSVMALWAASKGMGVLLKGLRRIFDRNRQPLSLVWRIIGLIFTLALCLAIILSLALMTFGDLIMRQIELWTSSEIFTESWMTVIRFAGTFLILTMFFMILYRVTGKKKSRMRQYIPGAIFSASAWVLFSSLFSWYVSNAGRFSLFYGSVTGIMILLLWIYFCSISLLGGGLLNALLIEKKTGELFVDENGGLYVPVEKSEERKAGNTVTSDVE